MNFKYIQNSFFFIFLGISTALFLYLIKDFTFTIFWALVLAIVFYPLYQKLLKKTKNKEVISSLLSLIIIVLLIITPLIITFSLVAKETIEITKGISLENIEEQILSPENRVKIDSALEYLNINPQEAKSSLINSLKGALSSIGKNTLNFGKSTINIIINFFITLYLLFFFFKDGKKILLKISEAIPLGNKIEKDIFIRFSTIVKSIFKGTLIVAIVQGAIGGLLFLLVGIKAALLWGVLMTLLSVIPALGPSIILIPTAIFFLSTGQVTEGLILIAGSLVVSVIDNVLRPLLVGNKTKIPDIVITISIFGGLGIYGITGLIIGPVIAGIFITAWQIFEEKFHKQLKRDG